MEIYKAIDGYDGRYLISNFGNIVSKYGNKTKHLLKAKSKDGYLFVRLCKNNIAKTKLIHRLVAECFIENENNLPQVDHIDENKENNNVENLQWLSCKDNTTKSQGKKIIQECLNTGIKKQWDSISFAAKSLGYDKGNIQRCCIGKNKKMYNSKWSYVC
jgi:hypothetical protein